MKPAIRIRSILRPLRALRLAVALCCLCVGTARAQFTRFQPFAEDQGLGNASVSAIGQDADGFVLLGTEAGLFRYDGTGVAPYAAAGQLPAMSWIRSIATDPAGRLWIATTTGLFVRHPGTAALKRVPIAATVDIETPHLLAVARNQVVLVDADGRLLRAMVRPGGVETFAPLLSDAMLARLPVLRRIRFVSADPEGGWLVGAGTTVFRIVDGAVTDLAATGLPPDRWEIARRGADGALWLRSLLQVAVSRPGAGGVVVAAVPDMADQLYAHEPFRLDVVPDRAGGGFTENAGGLLRWDGRDWKRYRPHEGGLPSNPIQALFFDREGSLWVGSAAQGAFRSIGLSSWEHWTTADGLPSDMVWSMARAAAGPLWVATYDGTVALGENVAPLPGDSENVAVTAAGRVWTTISGGFLRRLDRDRRQVDRIRFDEDLPTMRIDPADRLWLSTRDGVWLIADADAPASALRPVKVLSGSARPVFVDPDGAPWVATATGLYRRDPSGRFVLVLPAATLGETPGNIAFVSKREFWLSSYDGRGILRFVLDGGGARPLPPVAAPTIASNNVMFLHRDRRGWIWVGTDRGLDRFDGVAWRHVGHGDGPISDDMDEWAVADDPDGSLWFGTSRGLSHLVDPTALPEHAALHPLVTELLLGEKPIDPAPAVRLGWSSAPLTIHFVALDFADVGRITFRYRMRGLDGSWNSTAGHDVRYAALPAGHLVFELVAIDQAHGTVSAPISIGFHILAPWWRRPWFVASLSVAVVGAVVGAWHLRTRLLVLRQRRLEAMVAARTAEIEQARTELQRLAMTDPLTGLPNRRSIMDRVEAAASAREAAAGLAVLLLDIDHFKKINDNHGHLAGDSVLAAFGSRLRDCLRDGEVAGRYGGEEFCVILFGQRDAILGRVALLRSAVTDATYNIAERPRIVTASGGLAFHHPSDTSLSLLARADEALYEAKAKGRNRIEPERADSLPAEDADAADGGPATWSSHHMDRARQRADDRRRLETDLAAALARDEFVLHYQPVYDVDRDAVSSFEALLRWESPKRGRVPPAAFIPFAEEIGMMPAIGDWVLRAACREATAWPAGIKVSVNLSPAQFRLPDLVRRVSDALDETGLEPRRLELELTETAMVDNTQTVQSMLDGIRALGVPIALDDFGTGYSSLSFLRTLPFDRIKIDRSFVHDVETSRQAAAIVSAMVGMCRQMGVSITAEGIETDAQIAVLRAMGCRELQGYRLGRPAPRHELGRWLHPVPVHRAASVQARIEALAS